LKRKQGYGNLFILALPFVILTILFKYIPLVGWGLSFYEYYPGVPVFKNRFVGLDNFKYIFETQDIVRVFKNTVILSGLNFILMLCPLILAILINEIRDRRFQRIVQTVTTFPHFISWIVAYSLTFAILSNEGLLNTVLKPFGLSQNILGDPKAVYWFQSSMTQWKGMGWGAIIYIAAITGIDQELYEAAVVDGAGRFRCIWHVTIPSILPTFLVLALLNIASFINTGTDQHFVFQNSAIANNIETIDLYTYRLGILLSDYSYATAVGIFKSIISITLLFVVNNFAKRIRGENIV
jgi:ABC-type polysaccharide transport system permease subunit